MTKQDKMKINNLLVRMKQMEDEIERLKLFDNQIEANYNRIFDYGVTNRIMLDEQCRKIGELKAKLEAKLTCDFVKTAQKQAKIDVLNELREKYATSGSVNNNWATIIFVDDIDELIKEYEK